LAVSVRAGSMNNVYNTTEEQLQIKNSALWIHRILKVAPGIKFFNYDFIIFDKFGIWYLHELTLEDADKDLGLF